MSEGYENGLLFLEDDDDDGLKFVRNISRLFGRWSLASRYVDVET